MSCSVEGCGTDVYARGLCRNDYNRWNKRRKAGWPEPIDPRAPMPIGRPCLADDIRRTRLAEVKRASNARNPLLATSSKLARLERYALLDAMKSRPCMDCKGSFEAVCMDFDHRPDEVKLFNISSNITARMDRLLVEVAKCDIVCSNCHRIRTRDRRAL